MHIKSPKTVIDWLKKFRKRKPPTKLENVLMSVIKSLDTRIKAMAVSIVTLKAMVAERDGVIAELKAKVASDEAQMAEWLASTDGLVDGGESAGGVVG